MNPFRCRGPTVATTASGRRMFGPCASTTVGAAMETTYGVCACNPSRMPDYYDQSAERCFATYDELDVEAIHAACPPVAGAAELRA